MPRRSSIAVIDLFAGPGGLGEGFSAFKHNGHSPFDIRLSVEKDTHAHRTLLLRAFYRKLRGTGGYRDYLRRMRGEIGTDELFDHHPREADAARTEAWCAELGSPKPSLAEMRERVTHSLANTQPWVLIGGPPCQAYSVAGRSRNKGVSGYRFEADKRSTLYVEYLQFIADNWPSVFVMENVKGILSARLSGTKMFQQIMDDLHDPKPALRREGRSLLRAQRTHSYTLFALASETLFDAVEPRDFVVRAEDFGIPQARHRVILVGIRDDISGSLPRLVSRGAVHVEDAIGDLPPIRSGLSNRPDDPLEWLDAILAAAHPRLLASVRRVAGEAVAYRMQATLARAKTVSRAYTKGGEFVAGEPGIAFESDWYVEENSGGFCNHESRTHIPSDLHRYLYVSCYAAVHGQSPELGQFPPELLPAHHNVALALKGSYFADRFRVQRRGRPSTTITSHISKDGHYYIHYDPWQCRSLTVREAARLQTFPDSYIFEGPRTQQYVQVGNAVPPLLALQIARCVFEVIK